jgi:hypothetical protein
MTWNLLYLLFPIYKDGQKAETRPLAEATPATRFLPLDKSDAFRFAPPVICSRLHSVEG